MALVVESERRNEISDEELLTQHLSDIKLELETIKVRAWRKDDQILLKNIERIDNTLLGIMDLRMDMASRALN